MAEESDVRFRLELLRVVRGFCNGMSYAVKIRLPHALVMTLLFKRGDATKLAKDITSATVEHARSLALFALGYKALLALLKHARRMGLETGLPSHLDGFLAGAVAASGVWTSYTRVHFQIVLYLFSRVVVAFARSLRNSGRVAVLRNVPASRAYPVFAALVWGAVMWQFENQPETLQRSLRVSMQQIYSASNSWDSAWDFVPSPMAIAVVLAHAVLVLRDSSR